ncbi:uncharacterized protein LOC129910859 [Episyrphus balteatus]|uniref:uncharacterized protein LOC129910859 n=1 Tax=Episyrphus balteatus TaxID=286459 RepID=UPI002485C0DC|nr:uncharacterized protein LOC129910859 [Episyrphus balteatus]
MFKFLVFSCVIAAAVAVAKPGILSQTVGIASAPSIISLPRANIVRTVPIALAPSSQIISGGVISKGLVSGGLINGGLVSGGLVSSGKLLSGGLISGKLLI